MRFEYSGCMLKCQPPKYNFSFRFVFMVKLMKELGNDIIGKNITFTCESCFMADPKMIDFPANLPPQFNRRKEFRSI